MSLNPSLDVRSPHHEDVDEDARQEADDDRRQSVLHRDAMARHNLLTDKAPCTESLMHMTASTPSPAPRRARRR